MYISSAGPPQYTISDGSSSTVVDPFKNFAPSLTPYTVKLVADDGLGCKDSIIKANLITAKVPPAGDFFISPTPVITVPNTDGWYVGMTLSGTGIPAVTTISTIMPGG